MLPGIVPLYHTTSYVSIYFGIACVCVCVCPPSFFFFTNTQTNWPFSFSRRIHFLFCFSIDTRAIINYTNNNLLRGRGWLDALEGGEKRQKNHLIPNLVVFFFFFKSVGGKRMEAKKFRQWVPSFLFGFVSLSCCYLPSLPFGKVGRTSVCVSVNAIDSCIFWINPPPRSVCMGGGGWGWWECRVSFSPIQLIENEEDEGRSWRRKGLNPVKKEKNRSQEITRVSSWKAFLLTFGRFLAQLSSTLSPEKK